MANTDFIQATIEIFGSLITFVVAGVFVIITGNKEKSEKNLFLILIGSGLTLLFDAGWYICDGNTEMIAKVMNEICNLAIFLCNPILLVLLNRFVCNMIREKNVESNRFLESSAYIIALIAVSIPISNMKITWVYCIDDMNIYSRLFGWYVYTIINSIGMIMCIAQVIVNKKVISKKRRITIYIFWLAPFVGIALQSIQTGISFIQLGACIGSLSIIVSYLYDWTKLERKDNEVSEDRKKIWLIECVFSIMILFISAAIITCVVSVNEVSNKSSEQNSVSLAYMVSETVDSTLFEPINVSRTMAQSEEIINALTMGSDVSKDVEEKMLGFMKRIKEQYGYQMIFVASEKTRAYYTYDGFSRYMEESANSNDIWYSEFKTKGKQYELNIDADKDNNMSLAAFVNMEVRDEDGEFLGVCGVAMSIESLMDILSQYETDYNLEISLTDTNGLIQVNTDRKKIENQYCDISEITDGNYDVIYKRSNTKAIMKKNMGELGWYLVIEDNSPSKIDVFKVILPSMIIYVLGIVIMLAFSFGFAIHEKHRSKELMVTKVQSETAKKESEAKGRFLANMSHEIRTPINAVLGMDTMILRETNDSQIKEYAMSIRNAGNTLLSLINDILDISKIESGKMEIVPEEYDFSTLINDVMNMISIKAESKGIDINLEIDKTLPSELYGDDIRIRQIIVNLMNNAVKYTERGSVTLSVVGEVNSERVKLRIGVKDTGIGIKQEDLHKLTEDFVRIEESRNKNIEGTGLGMSITVQLLELMDSKLEVTSVYGEGSEFFFELEQEIVNDNPVGDINQKLKQKAENFEYEALFAAPDANVLVVDDNPVNRAVFVGLLKETKVSIDQADGGLKALNMVQNKAYDIIFLDHMMPDMDGIEVMKRIKESNDHPNTNTPVIVLTANAISGAKEEYLTAGFTDYLSKPIIPENLEKMMYDYIPKEKLVVGEIKKVSATNDKDSSSGMELPLIEGVDWNFARLHLADDKLLLSTIRNFRESIDSEADVLEELYDKLVVEADSTILDSYRIKVHAMKSNATLLGCVPIAGMAATLEYAAREGNISRIRDMTPHFIGYWREYKEKFEFFMAPDNDKIEINDITIIREYIEKLKDCIQVFDVHGADDAVNSIKQYKYAEDVYKIVSRMSVAVTNLDVDEVVNLCDEMLKYYEE